MYSKGIEEFNMRLVNRLVWFNTQRAHESLNNLSSVQYRVKDLPESHMYATRT